MKVFKFGGASVSSVERIQHMARIVQEYRQQPLVIIVSAMGKTTNALEKVAEAFYNGHREEALQLFTVIKQQHVHTAKYLLVSRFNHCLAQLNDFFTEVEWLLHDKPVRSFDYYYDQVVCVGELLSTSIVSHYLQEEQLDNEWLDVRDLLRTDNQFRNANISWNDTAARVQAAIQPAANALYVTQGFIGSTDENESTTLGREGSDYSAAIFANILDAADLTIWKDVEGVMSADPKQFPDAQFLPQLSFAEVIEMAYYGAQVIHPKTIKPLQNKGIPLLVKCFLDTRLPGTVISSSPVKKLPPIVVVKENQVLLHLNSQDFSFVGGQAVIRLYSLFGELNVQPNLIQTGAVSLQVCLDDRLEKTAQLATAAGSLFDVQLEKGLFLLTIRHFEPALVDALLQGKERVLVQQTKSTIQVLYR